MIDFTNLYEAVPVEEFIQGENGLEQITTPKYCPIPRERIEEALRDKFIAMYKAGNNRGLAGYGMNNIGTKFDIDAHITELINQTLR